MPIDPKELETELAKVLPAKVAEAQAEAQKQVNEVKSAKDKEIAAVKSQYDETARKLKEAEAKNEQLAKEKSSLEVIQKVNDLLGVPDTKSHPAPDPMGDLKKGLIEKGIPEDILKELKTEEEVSVAVKAYRAAKKADAQVGKLDDGVGGARATQADAPKTSFQYFKSVREQINKGK